MARRGATPATDYAGAAHQEPTTGRGILSQALGHVWQVPLGACALLLEAGVCCGKTVRRDLCRDRWVTCVPTATMPRRQQENLKRFALGHIFHACSGVMHFSPW